MRRPLLIIFLFLSLLTCSRNEKPEIIFIDDVEQPKKQLEKLNPSEIFSYTKYRPEWAPGPYYRGKDTTVIVVKTKKVEVRLQQQRHMLLNRFLDSVDEGSDILIAVDGILYAPESQKLLRALPSDSLSYVDTMERSAAKELYGLSARPITLIVNTYNLNYPRNTLDSQRHYR